LVPNFTLLNILEKIKSSFKSVFEGGASNQQFIEVFFTILLIASLVAVPYFLLKK
jgi:hypothetical protein